MLGIHPARKHATTDPGTRFLNVFAVEDTTVQITWGALGPGLVTFRAADTTVELEATGGPGAVVLEHLPADRKLTVRVSGAGLGSAPRTLTVQTLPSPPGEELYRIATVSDLHVGAAAFGYRDTMIDERDVDDLHPMMCTRAALAEAEAWGADRIVAKGDLTNDGRPFQWDWVGPMLSGVPVPMDALPGNHDTCNRRTVEPEDALAPFGVDLIRGVRAMDLPGIRLVLVDSSRPDSHGGSLVHNAAAVLDAARGDTPALVAMHHHLQQVDSWPQWPPGISRAEADPFLRDLGSVVPAALITAGHSHRHRRRQVGALTLTQVGSTKDYPGVWGGYAIHEGGVRQVVRRVSDPAAMEWTEYTASAVLGLWRHLGPGRLVDRCFTVTWPRTGRRTYS